jgi:hypothetical protein
MDTLPPSPRLDVSASAPADMYAPGDIYPRGERERELCARASRPDWLYLGGLVLLDGAAIAFGSGAIEIDGWNFKSSGPVVSLVSPALIGVFWGATIGGAWLTIPRCSPTWIGEPPREGAVHATWPLALSLALLAGATAPVIYGIAIGSGDLPDDWTTENRALHVVVAGVAGFGGALLPYLIPPRTWRAHRELERIRFGTDGHTGFFLGYSVRF